MGCPQQGILAQTLTFTVTTRNASGAAVDADSSPTYRVYEDQTQTAIVTGTMSKLDDANTTGFYSETISVTAAAGFEAYKTYTIYIEATVATTTMNLGYGFVCLRAEVAQELATGPVGPADVLAVVNSRLKRTETNVDRELRAALKEITGLGDFLEATESPTLAADSESVSLPTDFKTIRAVSIDGEPLDDMTLDDYLKGTGTGASKGEPQKCTRFKGEILFDTTADQDYTVRIDYFRYHPGDVSTILLPDEFREAIYRLTTAHVADSFDLDDQAKKWRSRFSDEMSFLKPQEKRPVRRVKYRDI